MEGTVTDFMTNEVITATPVMTLKHVDELLLKHSITGMPVVDDGSLVGVVSMSDIVAAVYDEQVQAQRISDIYQSPFPIPLPAIEKLASQSRSISDHMVHTTVGEVMSPAPVTVELDSPIENVARLMVTQRIHRVLVTDRGQLVGIISSLDLVGALIESQED